MINSSFSHLLTSQYYPAASYNKLTPYHGRPPAHEDPEEVAKLLRGDTGPGEARP